VIGCNYPSKRAKQILEFFRNLLFPFDKPDLHHEQARRDGASSEIEAFVPDAAAI